MRNFIRATTLLSVLAFAASPAAAATQSEFYLSLLRRGVASYDATRYTDAAKQLRLAAFGLVDTVDQYQLAHMYLAMTLDKMGQKDRAAESARRVIAAERVERKYANAAAPLRTAFEETAAKLLTPAELAMLRGGAIVPAPPRTSSSSAPSMPVRSAATTTTTTPPRTSTPVPVPQTAAKPPATQPVAKPPATQPQSERPVVTPPQQTARPENVAPQTSATTTNTTPPAPAATKPKPEPAPAKPVVKPPTTTPATTTTSTPPRTAPATTTVAPAPRPLTANEIATRMANAERALSTSNLTEARRGYRELLGAQGLDHESMIRVAEGLYRARDFAGALTAFANLGTLRRGEEPYRYYIAVAAFETGDRARAKRELAAALPYIEVTPDVARYRSRIESAP